MASVIIDPDVSRSMAMLKQNGLVIARALIFFTVISLAATEGILPLSAQGAIGREARIQSVELNLFMPGCPEIVRKDLDPTRTGECKLELYGFVPGLMEEIRYGVYSGEKSTSSILLVHISHDIDHTRGPSDPPGDGAPELGKVILLRSGENVFNHPKAYSWGDEILIVVPAYERTDVRSSTDLVFRLVRGSLLPVDYPFRWVDQLRRIRGLRGTINANQSPDYDKMTGSVPIWSNTDPVCCPTRRASASLALVGNAIVLRKLEGIYRQQ